MNIDIIDSKSNEKLSAYIKDIILIISFTMAMIISSYIKVPLFPVPFTMQTFVVVLSSFVIANRKACIPQIIYLLYGFTGAMVFSNGGGILYVFSPTFGYILGFVVMAYVISYMIEKCNNVNMTLKRLIAIGSIGVIIQLSIGTSYLYVVSNTILDTNISIIDTVIKGSIIFLPYDILKVILAGIIAKQTPKT